MLLAAELLDRYQATAHCQFLSYFPQRFPTLIVAPGHPRFVHDRDRLTAGGVASGLDASLTLVELLGGKDLAGRAKQATQYYPDPPVSSVQPPTPVQCPIPQARV
jgi:transcriptional regulator GlxA family with amidase domain